MKKIILFFLCFFLMACSRPVHPILQDNQGNKINFANYHGKWIVINYWATWCKPCYQEIPELNAFYKTYKNRSAVVLGVSYDHATNMTLTELTKKIGAAFPTLTTDPAKQLGIEHIAGLPATVLINPTGRLQKILLGEQTQQSLEQVMGLTRNG